MKAAFIALLIAAPLHAQVVYTDRLHVNNDLYAITYCGNVDGQPHTWINAAIVDSAQLLHEVQIHEAVHRVDMRADTSFCAHPTPSKILNTEVRAYCASNRIAVQYGANAFDRSTRTLGYLLQQFYGQMTPIEITETWKRGCGE